MRKKLLFGAVCACLSAALIGCVEKKETTNVNSTTEKAVSSDKENTAQEISEESNEQADDSVGAWILRKEVTDKEVLENVPGATLFADKLTLPISMDVLKEYPMDAVGISQDKLANIVNEYDESFTSLVFTVYDKTGAEYSYLPDLVLGKEKSDTETTIVQAISDGNWKMESYYFSYDTLGLTEEEYNNMCNSNPDVSGTYQLLDMLYDMLGAPNFVGWFCNLDNSTQDNGEYDASEYIEVMRYPEKFSSEGVSAYSTLVGWQFSDYGIVVDISETSDSRSGVSIGDVSDVIISYIPSSYGTLEDVYGINAIKDFIAAK